MFYDFGTFRKSLIHKKSSRSGTLFFVLALLSIFVIQSTLPQFGTLQHQHEGAEQAHIHPEIQSFQAEVRHHGASKSHAHPHEEKRNPLQIDQRASNQLPLLTQIGLFDREHTHTYDHFFGKLFVPTPPSYFHLSFQPVNFQIDRRWSPYYEQFVNPRAPPLQT